MLVIAKFALFAWVPFVLLVFAVLKPRRAVVFAYVGGWLFLPMLKIKFTGMPDLDKITAASFGVLIGAALFDLRTLLSFRPKWFDLPMFAWCLLPFVTSTTNDLGSYDGASNIVQQLGVWGIPYYMGRVYFNDPEGFKELGVGIVIGALAYLPFTWLEMLISPQLHKKLYGFFQHDFAQTKRWGSFRPMVFMQSGLALAMYMTTASLVCTWMWASRSVRSIGGVPVVALVGVLFVTSIFCKTMAATAFLFAGLGTLYWVKYLKSAGGLVAGLPILAMVAVPPAYMYLRAAEVVPRDAIVDVFGRFTAADRLQSLDTRLKAEDLVTERAFEAKNPWFGHGKWDPNDPRRTPWRVYNEWEKLTVDGVPYTVVRDAAPTDGLWIITLGQFGIAALLALTVTILLPAFILWRRVPLRYWDHPAVAPVAAMAVLLITHMIDNLLNGMVNSLFMLALGGVSAIGPAVRPIYRRYGPVAAQAVLDQATAGPAGGGHRGFPAYPAGYAGYPPGMPMPGYAGAVPAGGMAYPPQAGYAAVSGFPVIPGLGGGTGPIPRGQQGTGRPRR